MHQNPALLVQAWGYNSESQAPTQDSDSAPGA